MKPLENLALPDVSATQGALFFSSSATQGALFCHVWCNLRLSVPYFPLSCDSACLIFEPRSGLRLSVPYCSTHRATQRALFWGSERTSLASLSTVISCSLSLSARLFDFLTSVTKSKSGYRVYFGFCRKFSFESIWGMISPYHRE